MHWALNELFELAMTPQTREHRETTQLISQAKKQLQSFGRSYPEVLARQLPLLVNHVHHIFSMTLRQSKEIDYFGNLSMCLEMAKEGTPQIFEKEGAFAALATAYASHLEV